MSGQQGGFTRRAFVAGAAAAVAGAGPVAALAQTGQAQAGKAKRMLRVAMIGVQGHYGYVADGITAARDCRVVAIARSMPGENIDRIKAGRPWLADAAVFDDYRRMLDEVRPDVVGVFMPIARMGEACMEAAGRGCHVASEKPLASSIDELNELRKVRDRVGVRVTAFLVMRLYPEYMAARQAVRDGLIGEPVLVTAQKSYRWGDQRPEYYKDRKTYGGTIPWVGIHAIDMIRYVSGLEYASVTARHAVLVHKDYPECEDCGAMLFDMCNGGQATITIDYLRPQKAPSHGDDRLRVVGSKGIVEVRTTDKVFCELIPADGPSRELPRPGKKVSFFADFLESLRGGPPHVMSPDDPFRATEVALKAREAADTRKTIPL